MPKSPKTAKQIAAATKNILTYEMSDDRRNMTIGFIMGAVGMFIVSIIIFGLF